MTFRFRAMNTWLLLFVIRMLEMIGNDFRLILLIRTVGMSEGKHCWWRTKWLGVRLRSWSKEGLGGMVNTSETRRRMTLVHGRWYERTWMILRTSSSRWISVESLNREDTKQWAAPSSLSRTHPWGRRSRSCIDTGWRESLLKSCSWRCGRCLITTRKTRHFEYFGRSVAMWLIFLSCLAIDWMFHRLTTVLGLVSASAVGTSGRRWRHARSRRWHVSRTIETSSLPFMARCLIGRRSRMLELSRIHRCFRGSRLHGRCQRWCDCRCSCSGGGSSSSFLRFDIGIVRLLLVDFRLFIGLFHHNDTKVVQHISLCNPSERRSRYPYPSFLLSALLFSSDCSWVALPLLERLLKACSKLCRRFRTNEFNSASLLKSCSTKTRCWSPFGPTWTLVNWI